MVSYNYENINPLEFEEMCSALLTQRDGGAHYERFKEGADGGIDLRHIADDGKVTIWQCKRYRDFAHLCATLENSEVANVKRRNPDRYGVLTTCGLSPDNKDKIFKLFAPYIKTKSDIIGRQELDDYLARSEYQPIVDRTLGLWWQSFDVLKRTILNDVLGRSQFALSTFESGNKYTFWTQGLEEAWGLLQKNRVLILEGLPGIGKTTAAQMLVLKAFAQKYAPIVIREGIREGERAWDGEHLQIFYYDDFLGSNYREALTHSEASGICEFIGRVASSPNKLFVVTSRTVILRRREANSVPLRDNKIAQSPYAYSLTLDSEYDKARILYNRMLASDIARGAIADILRDRHYLEIIRHRNFHPRLVRHMLMASSHQGMRPGETYYARMNRLMNSPGEVWKTLFEDQISETEFALTWAIFLAQEIDVCDLKRLYIGLKGESERDFSKSVESVVGSIWNHCIDEHGRETYQLYDPSVGDYLLTIFKDYLHMMGESLGGLCNPKAVLKFYEIAHQPYRDVRADELDFVSHDLLNRMGLTDKAACTIAMIAGGELLEGNPDERYAEVVDKFKGFDPWQCPDGTEAQLCRLIVGLGEADEKGWMRRTGIDLTGDLVVMLLRETEDFTLCARLYNVAKRSGALMVADDVAELLTCRLGEYASMEILPNMDCCDFDIEPGGSWSIPSEEKDGLEADLRRRLKEEIQEYALAEDLIDVDRIVDSIDFSDYFQPDERELAKYRDYDYERDWDGWRGPSTEETIDGIFKTFPPPGS